MSYINLLLTYYELDYQKLQMAAWWYDVSQFNVETLFSWRSVFIRETTECYVMGINITRIFKKSASLSVRL